MCIVICDECRKEMILLDRDPLISIKKYKCDTKGCRKYGQVDIL